MLKKCTYLVSLALMATSSSLVLANTAATSHGTDTATTTSEPTSVETTTAETTATTDHGATTTATTDHGTTTASTEPASDRSTYTAATGALHIPYVTVDGTAYMADLVGSSDASGNLVFSLSNAQEIHAPHWTYADNWGSLSTDYTACSTGTTQSPIDISSSSPSASLGSLTFNYSASAVNILNNGHTVQVNYDSGSSVSVNGHSYDLLQFHFHTPSEHNVDSASFPMEMHMVHSDASGNLAVVGVLINEGAENAAFNDVTNNVPATESEAQTIDGASVDAAALLPSTTTEYRYSGSLTTPPCSEGVQWLVMKNPIEMSAAQISALQTAMGTNNRPIQAVNARNVISNM